MYWINKWIDFLQLLVIVSIQLLNTFNFKEKSLGRMEKSGQNKEKISIKKTVIFCGTLEAISRKLILPLFCPDLIMSLFLILQCLASLLIRGMMSSLFTSHSSCWSDICLTQFVTLTPSTVSEFFQHMWPPFFHLGRSAPPSHQISHCHNTPVCAGMARPLWLMVITFVSLFIFFPLKKTFFLFHIKIPEVHIHRNKLLEDTPNTEEKRTLILPRQVRGKNAGTREG